MKKKYFKTLHIRYILIQLLAILCFGFLTSTAISKPRIDSFANKVLQNMSNYIKQLTAFTVNGDVDEDVVGFNGQKLQLSSSGKIVVMRPNKFHADKMGPDDDVVMNFDGKTLTISEKNRNVYIQLEKPGTINSAIQTMRTDLELDVPAGDLFYSDSYSGLIANVTTGTYLGTAYVHGVKCYHLAFRADKFDWQLWVQTGNKPLPMKYVITSKWITGSPQYAVRFSDWNTKPQITTNMFKFIPPKGATKLKSMPDSGLVK